MFNHILVICTGNICRSPYGEARLKLLMPDKTVESAGVATEKSRLQLAPADPNAVKVAHELGISLIHHQARQVTQPMVEAADLILAMERNQIEVLCDLIPTARSKSFLMGQWIGMSTINDPYQQDEAQFHQAFSYIDKAALSWQKKISG